MKNNICQRLEEEYGITIADDGLFRRKNLDRKIIFPETMEDQLRAAKAEVKEIEDRYQEKTTLPEEEIKPFLKQIKQVKQKNRSALGIEKEYYENILKELQRTSKNLQSKINSAMRDTNEKIKPYNNIIKTIKQHQEVDYVLFNDLSFLEMSKKTKVEAHVMYGGSYKFDVPTPALVVYNLNNPAFKYTLTIQEKIVKQHKDISGEKYRKGIYATFPQLPKCFSTPLRKAVSGTLRRTGTGWWNKVNIDLETSFYGLIPTKTKKKIEVAKDDFEDDIYIIAEPDNWHSKPVPTGDPIVVGVKNNHAYFIDEFTPTLLERLVVDNYVAKK